MVGVQASFMGAGWRTICGLARVGFVIAVGPWIMVGMVLLVGMLISVLVLLILLILILILVLLLFLILVLLVLLILVLLMLLMLLVRFSALTETQLLEYLVYFCCTFEPGDLGKEAKGRRSSRCRMSGPAHP